MSALLFRLRNVPDDEAEEVRDVLKHHNIEFYETSAGNWGISMPAIWVQHDEDLARAKTCLKQYQEERTARQRADYKERLNAGDVPSVFDNIKQRPLICLLIFAFSLFILYVMISPIVKMVQFSAQ